MVLCSPSQLCSHHCRLVPERSHLPPKSSVYTGPSRASLPAPTPVCSLSPWTHLVWTFPGDGTVHHGALRVCATAGSCGLCPQRPADRKRWVPWSCRGVTCRATLGWPSESPVGQALPPCTRRASGWEPGGALHSPEAAPKLPPSALAPPRALPLPKAPAENHTGPVVSSDESQAIGRWWPATEQAPWAGADAVSHP